MPSKSVRLLLVVSTLIICAVFAFRAVRKHSDMKRGLDILETFSEQRDSSRTGERQQVETETIDLRIPVGRHQLAIGRSLIEKACDFTLETEQHALVVDKSAYTIAVYKAGAIVASYPVELGQDPVNPKKRQGDGRTPEGMYRIAWRRDIGQTTFHRALLLDYPNESDKDQGYTGSLVEIHGHGAGLRPGKGGYNWTDGCIALSNDDIDALFELGDINDQISSGTPVTIVFAGTLDEEDYRIVVAAATPTDMIPSQP